MVNQKNIGKNFSKLCMKGSDKSVTLFFIYLKKLLLWADKRKNGVFPPDHIRSTVQLMNPEPQRTETLFTLMLGSITTHPRYDDFSEMLATTSYMMTSTQALTDRAIELNLLMHPVVVTRAKRAKDRFICVGGLRSLMLAKSSLPLEKKITAILVEPTPQADIELLVIADILLTHLLFSVRTPETIGQLYVYLVKKQKAHFKTLLTEDMLTKKLFIKQLDFAPNTIFHPGKKYNSDASGNI
jgi:hypothetical protein